VQKKHKKTTFVNKKNNRVNFDKSSLFPFYLLIYTAAAQA